MFFAVCSAQCSAQCSVQCSVRLHSLRIENVKMVQSYRELSICLNVWQHSKVSRIEYSSIYRRFTVLLFWRLFNALRSSTGKICNVLSAFTAQILWWATNIHQEYFELSTSFTKIIILIFLFLIYNCFFIQFCNVFSKICDACEKGMTSLYQVNI